MLADGRPSVPPLRSRSQVIVRGLADGWRCRREWVVPTDDGVGTPDFDRLLRDFGAARVPVVGGGGDGYGAECRKTRAFGAFVAAWRARWAGREVCDGSDSRVVFLLRVFLLLGVSLSFERERDRFLPRTRENDSTDERGGRG